MDRRALVVGTIVLPWTAPRAAEMAPAELEEWKVPWENSRPRDPFATTDKVWFVGQRGNYVANLDPTNGKFAKFDLPPKALPHNVVVDGKGVVWYAGNGDAHIGRIDPVTGTVERIDMPDPAARDPHTLTFDRKGQLWFTVQGGNFIGRLDPETRAVKLIAVPTKDARPYGIKIDSQGRPWVVEFGTNKLAVVDPTAMTIAEVTLPRAGARPRRIEITPDDAIWYVDYAEGFLGRYDPKIATFEEWLAPGGAGAQPYGMALDARGRLWFVEFGVKPARFVGFDTTAKKVVSLTDIPSGGGVRHMHFHEPSQTVWFGTDSGTIGRISVN
jgi:virginiamycin B lyase